MEVIGIGADGVELFRRRLGHGENPAVLVARSRLAVLRPLRADRNASGELELVLSVAPVDGQPLPRARRRGRDAALRLADEPAPARRQRIAAYALVTSPRGLLATEFSDKTSVPGQWGMPGGGIDGGEQPAQAVVREIVEETGQTVELGDLVEVQTSHWVGRSPAGVLEDFHAVRLLYTAWCAHPTEPVVADVGGTTESGRWLADWHEVRWTAGWAEILRRRSDLLRP